MKRKKVSKSPIRSSAQALVAGRFRQIHLDFHTSEHIPDVGEQFDPEQFAEILSEARVNWITLFGKCHHGLSYYPTQAGTVHPSLKFDLLGEQIEACRKRDIVTPVYISVRLDEHHVQHNPGWPAITKEGQIWKWGDTLTAGWTNHCLNNPLYVDELAAQAEEVLRWYDAEGIFFDMCYTAKDPGCYCPRCFDSMKKLGLDFSSDADHRKHEYKVTRDYTRKLARAVRAVRPNATLFFNSRVHPGFKPELDILTHAEIEALPTGGWGYAYFPIHSRYARTVNRPLQGMTARFHKSWADFGGLKTKDMLSYEAGTILAAGAVVNVGDQLHPRGTLDRGAYEVIGHAFKHVEACEPWCENAVAPAEIAVMLLPANEADAKDDSGNWTTANMTMTAGADGAGRMLLEAKHQFNLIYTDDDLTPYRLVILPDRGYVPEPTRKALREFIKKGGAVLASYHAAFTQTGPVIPEIPARAAGEFPSKPCYLQLGKTLGKGLPESEYVFYDVSLCVKPVKGAVKEGRLISSYFNRSYDAFCSHNQTPSDKVSPHPLAVIKGKVAYIAPALFGAYREHAYSLYKTILVRIIDQIMPDPLVRTTAPSAMEVSVMKQSKKRRLITHLVNFQPQRRHTHVEWIEDIYPIQNIPLSVRTDKPVKQVTLAPQNEVLPFTMNGPYCSVTVPSVHAHQMVVFESV